MPVYVYACPACAIEIEERRPISKADDPLPCPICGENCSRAITVFSIGSGRKEAGPSGAQKRTHRPGCPCCAPRVARKTTDGGKPG